VINPRYNFMVQKVSWYSDPKASAPTFEQEVVSFQQTKRSTFFPKVVRTSVQASVSVGTHNESICRFGLVEINEALDPSLFRYSISPGMKVMDEIKGISYVMGDKGIPRAEPIPIPEPPSEAETVYIGSDEIPRSSSQTTLILIIAAGLLLLSLSVAAFLWLRARKSPSVEH